MTLAPFYEFMAARETEISNPAAVLLPPVAWTYAATAPGRILTLDQIRQCWLAAATPRDTRRDDIRQRTTPPERLLLLVLSGALLCNNAPEIRDAHDENAISIDSKDDTLQGAATQQSPLLFKPEVDFLDRHCNTIGDRIYEEWITPDYFGMQTRARAWAEQTIEEIARRADIRLPDGSRPTPWHFQQFWLDTSATHPSEVEGGQRQEDT